MQLHRPRKLFRDEFVHLYFLLCPALKLWLESRFKILMRMLLIIKLTTQPIFLVFITLVVFKTEYFPCDFHFYVLNITNKPWKIVCGMDFRQETWYFIISPALAYYLVFWIQTLICLFKMGSDVSVIILSINWF